MGWPLIEVVTLGSLRLRMFAISSISTVVWLLLVQMLLVQRLRFTVAVVLLVWSEMSVIAFTRIKGWKPFDNERPCFGAILSRGER